MKHVSKIIMLSLITTQLLSAKIPYSIILPFEQYPTNDSIEKLIDPAPFPSTLGKKGKALTYFELKSPHRKRIYKQNKISLSGIPIAYYGYIGTTTEDGSIMFSRMHDESIFYILVCTKINPIFMLENTVHHLEIGKTNKYAFYKVSKIVDEKTKAHLWVVEKEKISPNKQLPLETIIIFAQPEDVYVPEGISLTNDSPQTILPVIYIKNDKNNVRNSLEVLDIKYLFETIEPIKKQ